MSGGNLLNHGKWWLKIIEWIFMQFTFNILWVILTQKIITCRVFENFTYGCEGICMSEEKFIKPWQVMIKIIEYIFMQFHIQHFMSDS